MNNRLPQSSLITIHKLFVRPHLDYGDEIFDTAYNNFFQQKHESLQNKASLAITGAIKDSPAELGLKSLQNGQWF